MHYIINYYADRTACGKTWSEVGYAVSAVQLRVSCPACIVKLAFHAPVVGGA